MDDNKQQLHNLLDRLEKLPPQLKDAIFSDINADKMFEIGKQHNLHIDKLGEMVNETGLLMLGITHPNEFVGNLAERLQVDRQTASSIADDINREIFAPVREHLRTLFGIATQEETSPSKFQERSSALSAIAHQSATPANNLPQQTTSLEDLEAELERALAEEKGIQPLSMLKKQAPAPKPLAKPEPSYGGADPYREQVGEDLPNLRGKAYTPSTAIKKEISEERLPENGRLISKISPASGFQPLVSRVQPTPAPKPVEEHSPFSPLGRETPPVPTHTNPTSPLSAFRGFKMNNAAPETKDTRKDFH